MRITATAKSATRQRILQAAMRLFVSDGWQNTTTRDIALAAGIATGTLFNYFPTKESIAAALMAEALERAGEEFRAGRAEENSLEADLFSLIWTGLRSLRELRKFLAPPLKRSSPRWRASLPTVPAPPSASITWNWGNQSSPLTAFRPPGPP